MAKIIIGKIINGFKVIKTIFKSMVPKRSLYLVKCMSCGNKSKKREIDLETEKCSCCSKPKEESVNKKKITKRKNVIFDKTRMMDSIGVEVGKYVVIGFFLKEPEDTENIAPSMKRKLARYIVRCSLCGNLCIMSNNNLTKSKARRDKNVMCNHKVFFDKTKYDKDEYYLDESVM